ncbi:MAG: hypothetical protein CFH33_00009 [Alphaproteobacteria bacterium MarineAlpha9_Bin3]|nr:MAG: hypothetical protein CFH33_00009 [Alphaproteobacteria bacterium MarineAlpha9_Bin3]|tara:strand:+ start:1272 stop:1613 length:342 start_codon:yes stop_codon:yes gene_type:complete
MKNKFIITKKNNSYNNSITSYIKNNDFTKIMSLFSRMLKANLWKDYSFSLQKENIIFCFYRHSFETPVYKIVYEKKSNNFKIWTIYHQNNKVRSSTSLEKTIKWIESRYLKSI